MRPTEPNQELQPSVFDRLIDPEAGGTKARRGYTVEQMFRVVQGYLEDLLNTRQTAGDLPAEFAELHRSIYGYGLPDLTALNAVTDRQRAEIGRAIEAVIGAFEPRLKDVRATLVPPRDAWDRTVRFRVDARLCLEPAPEVAFDTVLEVATGHYDVKPSGG
jgi:type VI secretion system protein ImpF